MSTVVKLTPAPVLDETAPVDFDQAEIQRAALQVFDEMADGGCSLRDCITAVYLAGMEKITGAKPVKRAKKPSVPLCPYEAIIGLYHQHLAALPAVQVMNTGRKKAMRDFWAWVFESRKGNGERRATDLDSGLAWVGLYFHRASENAFLMGKTKRSAEHQGWVPDIDYIVSPRGMKQVIEKTESES
jgi:hypothetical protein